MQEKRRKRAVKDGKECGKFCLRRNSVSSCVPMVASDQRSSADHSWPLLTSCVPSGSKRQSRARRGIEAVGKTGGKMKMQMKRMKHVTWFDNFCICFKSDVHSGKDIASLFTYQSINLSNGKEKVFISS